MQTDERSRRQADDRPKNQPEPTKELVLKGIEAFRCLVCRGRGRIIVSGELWKPSGVRRPCVVCKGRGWMPPRP